MTKLVNYIPQNVQKKEHIKNTIPSSQLSESLSRQHYQMFADLLKEIPNKNKRKELADKLIALFQKDNSRFDSGIFLKAAGLFEGKKNISEGESYSVNGYYGTRNPAKIYVYDNGDGTFWYAVRGSQNVNLTSDKIRNGVNVERLRDIDYKQTRPINTERDLEKAVMREDYNLTSLIKERIDLDQYASDMFDALVTKKLKIGQWTSGHDKMSGVIEWYHPKVDGTVFATPFWNGDENIPIDYQYDSGNVYKNIKKISFKPTGNIQSDISKYIQLMNTTLRNIMPKLKQK